MKALYARASFLARLLCLLSSVAHSSGAQSTVPSNPAIEFIQNRAEILRAGSKTWDAASTNKSHNSLYPGDELRTGENSRVGLRLSGHKATLILDSNSRFIIPSSPQKNSAFELLKGRLFNLHRGPAEEQRFKTPTVSAIVRGTDFSLEVDADGTTKVSMLAGEVRLENSLGQLDLKSREEATVKPGEAPRRTAAITVVDVIQWCLYFPAVLDSRELPFSNEERQALDVSLHSFEAGDLLHALASLPREWRTGSRAQQFYGASLLLSVGSVDDAKAVLDSLKMPNEADERSQRLARLEGTIARMVSIVKLERPPSLAIENPASLLASESLVESYSFQAAGRLESALVFARHATQRNPDFGFAWVRVAELEFGFGRLKEAKAALRRALQLGRRNAQAAALQGFVFSAENRIKEAIEQFDSAIALDGKLANGWLGRGLCRFRQGRTAEALNDLQMAATVEPQRASLRSCLAKAWSETWMDDKAHAEITLAEQLDPNDPTAWLYSALIQFRGNRVNEAIERLERSKELNDNRSLFRSRMLLDEDLAVRSANLAAVYRDAGLPDVSLREATRAVDQNYASYSAHLFLAQSYDSLRDPRQVNLRYESPWFNELLLANLLAPVGAGTLSQNISQQEYSKLLQKDGLGISSSTEYASRGDLREAVSLFGTYGRASFAVDSQFASLNGERRNDDQERWTFYGKLKLQVTPQDTVFAQIVQYENTSGDIRQYYDQSQSSSSLRFKEMQEPNVYLGLNHEWAPGNHTLLLAARLQDGVKLTDANAGFPTFSAQTNGPATFGIFLPGFGQTYRSGLTAYSTELQQIWQDGWHTVVAGGRAQIGKVTARSTASFSPFNFPPEFFGTSDPSASRISQTASADLNRYTGYLYGFADVLESLQLSAGLAYDYLTFPNNLDLPPVVSGERNKDQLSPKAGFRWNMAKDTNLRGVYTRSLGGTYYDASIRLEPSQIAGFNQTFRSAIPESVAGLVPGSTFETWGLGFDCKPTPATYLGVSIEGLNSDATRLRGAFNFYPPAKAAQYRESLDFKEKSVVIDLNQMVGMETVLGVRYRISHAELQDDFPQIAPSLPSNGSFTPRQNLDAILHEVDLNALWNHRSGLFAGIQGAFYAQANRKDSASLDDSSFWQINASVGYRFLQRRAVVQISLLNLTDQNYRLNPLNLHADFPRTRTFVAQLSFVL